MSKVQPKQFSKPIYWARHAREYVLYKSSAKAPVFDKEDEKPIMIGRLQRYAMDYAAEKKITYFHKKEPNGKRIAIIGAGPAGLSCAGELAKLGFDVTCFEKKTVAGGLDTYGIVVFREPVEVSLAEVKMIEELGVKIKTNVTSGKTFNLTSWLNKYDAVFVAVGLGQCARRWVFLAKTSRAF